ncbi:MAG TPA: hypothetical protein VEP30_01140 [Chthoniobacterales bacterium]|nr:hypothetical protein [Chthoniobacterales bacterium]
MLILCLTILGMALFPFIVPLRASDHADPIHLPQGMEIFDDGKPNAMAVAKLAGNTTDLFVFPIKDDGKLADFPRNKGQDLNLQPAELAQIKALAVILCVRPALRKAPPLDLSTYTYSINMDLHSRVLFDKADELGRYGGSVPDPEKISSDVTIEIQLNDDTTLKKQAIHSPSKLFKNFDNVHVYNDNTLKEKAGEVLRNAGDIHLYTGYKANTFIFPRFFGTNIVAMVMIIPISCFPEGQQDLLCWATTSDKNGKQFDHVGRSLRTQNPRFDLLNTLPPKDHVAALKKENENPSLMRDLFVKFGFDNLFEYRPWDFTPDVMIYSSRFNAGYPNGRCLNDDVAALLARYGDTLLLELSYKSPKFPRATTIDKPFLDEFPYLAEPWPDSDAKPGPVLSARNQTIIRIALGVAIAWALLGLWKLIELLVKFVRVFFKKPIRA